MRRGWPALLMAAAGLWAPAASALDAASVQLSGGAGLGYDGNPGSAETGKTVSPSGFATARLAATLTQRPDGPIALLLRGSVDGQQYFDHVGLSNARAGGLLRVLYRPDGSFFAPTLALWGSAAAWQFGSSMRSGAEYRGGAYAVEQLNTAISLRAGGNFAERRSASSVFDLRGETATLDADWLLGDALSARLGYEFRYGSFAVSTPQDSGAAQNAAAQQADDALRREGLSNVVYRLKGHTQIGTLGLNYALTPLLALDAQVQQIHTRSDFNDHYNRWLAEVGVLLRF